MDLIVRDLESGKEEIYTDFSNIPAELKPKTHRELLFITTNQHKVNELTNQLSNKSIVLKNSNLHLPEIQDADPLTIAQDKCCRAFEAVNGTSHESDHKTVLVEDVCLNFRALNGLPGPYIKWFVDILGPDGLYKMLSGYEDKTAEAVCTYAIMADRSKVVFCRGTVVGEITSPKGQSWGWDPCFMDPATGLTYAQMSAEQKAESSHRAQAIKVLNAFL